MKKKKTKRRNPTDSTMRNVRASNKRDESLKKRVLMLEWLVDHCNEDINILFERVNRLTRRGK